MNEDKINKLLALVDLVDTKTNIEEFVSVFGQVVDYLKKNQDAMAGEVTGIIARLDEMSAQMSLDNKNDLNNIKGLIASALVDLRAVIDNELSTKLATIHSGADGAVGPEGPEGPEGPQGKTGATGAEGSPDTPDQVVEKVNSSSVLIKKERVEGLVEAISRSIANGVASAVGITTTVFFKNGTQIGRAKNINIIEGNNVTASVYQTGDQMNISLTSTASGSGNFATEETPTGTIDGANVTFTVANTPIAGTMKLYLNGARQQQGGVDYSISGSTITFTIAPPTGSILFVDYQY